MKILGLNGFGSLGRIDKYFTQGCFPFKRNWTKKDASWALSQYNVLFQDEPFIVICFSDGGTIGHRIAHTESRCKGLIAHSAVSRIPSKLRNIPIQLLSTKYDLTGMGIVNYKSWLAYRNLPEVWNVTLPRNTWHGHEFANGLLPMRLWAKTYFNYDLPVK